MPAFSPFRPRGKALGIRFAASPRTAAHLADKAVTLGVSSRARSAAALGFAGLGLLAVSCEPALAGTDATFSTALNQFTGFLEGSGGKIITVLSLAGGIVGLASGRFSLGQVAIPVGVGVGAGTGIPIVTSTVTAVV